MDTETLIVAFGAVLFFIMATLAAVLVVALATPSSRRARKTILAAVGGPGVPMVLTGAAILLGGAYDGIETAVGLVFMAGVAMLVIGWPVAWLATQRLERLMRFDTSPFE